MTEKELTSKRTAEHRENTYPEIANSIRMKSEAGKLVHSKEILRDFVKKGVPELDDDGDLATAGFLKDVLKNNEDLREISDKKGDLYYYSTRSMADAYARILIQRDEDPLLLIAEIIRENSQRYPRPLRLDIFEAAPFGLAAPEISLCLKRMAEHQEYQDIQQTTTSFGTVFLYSKLYLEPDYASMLAEWIDVGQSKNP